MHELLVRIIFNEKSTVFLIFALLCEMCLLFLSWLFSPSLGLSDLI